MLNVSRSIQRLTNLILSVKSTSRGFSYFSPERKQIGGVLGIGSTSFLCFSVWSYGLRKQPVYRRYSDFVWLRAILSKFHPSEILPPIPNKKASKRLPRQIQKRMRILTFFLNDLVKNPIMFNNRYVQAFLTIEDNNKF